MPWPTFTPQDQHRKGSGYLLAAPIGSTVPTWTVAGSVFTNTWDPAWYQLGRTSDDGITITQGQENASFSSSQEAYPFLQFVTQKKTSIEFTLYDYNQDNIKLALNGGNWSASGTGTAAINTYTPAAPGAETYAMLGWIGPNDDEVMIFYKTFCAADVSMEMKRDNPRPLHLTMEAVIPAVAVSSKPYTFITAGQNYA